MGGIASITGEYGGNPTKIGVGVSDIITGLYAITSILSYSDIEVLVKKVNILIFH